MLRMANAPNRAQPVAEQFWAVINESNRSNTSLGYVLKVFRSQQAAERYQAKVKKVVEMNRQGLNARLAFHPSVNIGSVIADVGNRNFRPRLVQLNQPLPIGESG